jgi:hypothetical protein
MQHKNKKGALTESAWKTKIHKPQAAAFLRPSSPPKAYQQGPPQEVVAAP